MSAREPQTWTKVVLVTADCLTCGESRPEGLSRFERPALRRWARKHATDNPGHHAVVETTHGRSYQVRDD